MSLPVLRLAGSPYAQGLQHGRGLADRIAHNVAVYFRRFEREVKVPRPEVLHRSRAYLEVLETQSPEYLAGIRGIAEGSAQDLVEIAALNVRYEILYFGYTRKAMGTLEAGAADGCTSFALTPAASASGHLVLGQNWDWIPEVLGAVLHTTGEDGLVTAAFTEAGIFGGKLGLNSAGIGLVINGLISTGDDWSRLRKPFHVRCWEILRCRRFEEALRVVTAQERSCSANFLIGQTPDRVADIESAPDRTRRLDPEAGRLTHANHFVDPEALAVDEPLTDRRPWSCRREARLAALLDRARPATTEAIQSALQDHHDGVNAICRHPDPALPEEQRSITVTSAIMDLHERWLLVSDGQPCRRDYQRISLGGDLA